MRPPFASSIAAVVCAVLLLGHRPAGAQQVPAQVPREARPNVIVIMADDVGFSMNSPFGGPVPTPNYDALVREGVRFNQFHTTAQCSPTRASLLTGRNPHRVNVGSIIDTATNEPGYSSVMPKSAATMGRVLQLNGYATSWFGKVHVTPRWELTAAGPFDRWPTGLGFDYFYGFMNGETDQWNPTLYVNTTPVPRPDTPGYILDRDLVDHAIDWMRTQKSIAPDRPFFTYLATGTVHAPLEAPADWIAKFRGRFDLGWDRLREQTFARQKQEGVVPPSAVLTPRPASVPAWASLTDDQRKVAVRTMEVAAAQSAYFDAQLGRLFAALKADGHWNNTLIVYINGDNGAAHVAGPLGSPLTGPGRTMERALATLDQMGSAGEPVEYNVGWAWAMNTPFQYWKQMSGHLGAIRNGLTIVWPGHVRSPGTFRSQFGFVSDIAPTIYEATGVSAPAVVDGVAQMPLDGISLLYALDDASAPSRRTSQYFEINANRGYYKDGWFAGTTPPPQIWEPQSAAPSELAWELYRLDEDYSQSKDLAAAFPEKVAELKREFEAAERDNGFKVKEAPSGRPVRTSAQPFRTRGRNHFTYHASVDRLADEGFPALLGAAFTLSANVSVPAGAADGTIISQGGLTAGWGLHFVDGRPTFHYLAKPFAPITIRGDKLTPGRHAITVKVSPGAGRGDPLAVSLSVDAKEPVQGQIPHPITHMPSGGVGLGRSFNAPLPDGRDGAFVYHGEIEKIELVLH
ncbi:arylsulfatase [Ramlibacter albus]|uniref:Arylsulfatase n=1 Tax=Ramlibacter albus TaxID=2079448 RepID=A0A923MCX1_9BURK|nr:arylsulfatase [Ramlibacter albus]MBC5766742.1 arylsulfatase [Ramlibacter albus]